LQTRKTWRRAIQRAAAAASSVVCCKISFYTRIKGRMTTDQNGPPWSAATIRQFLVLVELLRAGATQTGYDAPARRVVPTTLFFSTFAVAFRKK